MKKRVAALIAVIVTAGLLFPPGAPPASAGGCRGGAGLTTGSGVEVSMSHSCFSPTVLHVDQGQTVNWTNTSEMAHTVSGAALSFGDYEELGAGQAISYAFERPGVYPYFCFLHPGMVGAVVVGDGQSATPAGDEALAALVASQPDGDAGNANEAAQTTTAEDPTGTDALLILGAVAGLLVIAAGVTLASRRIQCAS